MGDRRAEIARQLPGRVPFIAPPSSTKSKYLGNPVIRKLWQDAFQGLQKAEHIYFLGYSVPQQDLAAMGLITEGIGDRKPSITVVDLCPDKVVANLTELLIPNGKDDDRSNDVEQESACEESKDRFEPYQSSGKLGIQSFSNAYFSDLICDAARGLSVLARSLPTITDIGTSVNEAESYDQYPIVGQISIRLPSVNSYAAGLDFDHPQEHPSGTLVIKSKSSVSNVDNLALPKLVSYLQTHEVKQIVLALQRQSEHDSELDLPIVHYTLSTNSQLDLHKNWCGLTLSAFKLAKPS